MEEAAQPPLPSTMRALRKTRPENGAELLDVLVPAPGPGEVLIRVEAASICGTDLHIYNWDPWAAGRLKNLPMTFGHEVAGFVQATGSEVHHLRPGAFVAAEGHVFCGFCRQCRIGRAHTCENLKILGDLTNNEALMVEGEAEYEQAKDDLEHDHEGKSQPT